MISALTRPGQFGFRFSLKAATPSARSPEKATVRQAASSTSSPARRSSPCPSRSARLAARSPRTAQDRVKNYLTKYLVIAAEAGGDPELTAKMLNARPKKPAPEGDGMLLVDGAAEVTATRLD